MRRTKRASVRVAGRIVFWGLLIAALRYLFASGLLFSPALGAATAALLIWGPRAWPAVLFGSLAGGLALGFSGPDAAGQAVADTAQALLARYLVGRYVGFPLPLFGIKQLLRFHLLIGPLACAVGAAFRLLLLRAVSIPLSFPPLAFFALDGLGRMLGAVLLTAPLLCLFLPEPPWTRRKISVALPIFLLLAVCMYGRHLVQRQIDRTERETLTREASALSQDLRTRLQQCRLLLASVAALQQDASVLNRAGLSTFWPRIQQDIPQPRWLLLWSASQNRLEVWPTPSNLDPTPAQVAVLRQALGKLSAAVSPSEILLDLPADRARMVLSLWPRADQPGVPPPILGAVFDAQSLIGDLLTDAQRDPTIGGQFFLHDQMVAEKIPRGGLAPPLIEERLSPDKDWSLRVSRRFDTNGPRPGLPIALINAAVLLFYLLRLSSQISLSDKLKQDLETRAQSLHLLNDELEVAMQAARESAQAKALFLANMSHEIRTPMNGILGLTRLVIDSGLKPAQSQQLRHVEQSATALLGLLNDLLDVSKTEANTLSIVPGPQSLSAVLEQAVRALNLAAEEKGLEILLTVDADLPDRITTDGDRLRQILLNLLGNAIKFTEHGEVELAVTVPGWTEQQACLLFSVCDTGIGIPPQDQQRIFAPFVQGPTSMSQQSSGAGLGLAISHRLVQRMGGELMVRSVPGLGSTFSFLLTCPAQREQPPVPPPAIEAARIPVLVRLSHRKIQGGMEQLLNGWGFPLTQSASAAQLLVLDETSLADTADTQAPGIALLPLSQLGSLASQCHSRGIIALVRPVLPGVILQALSQAITSPTTVQPSAMLVQTTPGHYSGRRALVADDNDTNRLVAALLLEPLGFSTDHAGDGEAALRAALNGSYDLIVMDLRMPRLDGYQAALEMRRCGVWAPIIAATAFSNPELIEQAIECGMDTVLFKPITADRLASAIVELISTPAEQSALWQRLCQAMGGEGSASHVARAFLHELPELLQRLDQAGDQMELDDARHALKGSSEIFGSTSLSERLAQPGPDQASVKEIVSAARRLELALRTLLERVRT